MRAGVAKRVWCWGGEQGLPFLSFEASTPHRPLIAGEVFDTLENFPDLAKRQLDEDVQDPAKWARRWVEDFDADLICLKLHSTNPEGENKTAEEAASTIGRVLEEVKVPLIVYGCGHEEKDAKTMEKVSNLASQERLVLAPAEENAYKTISAAAMANHHAIIAFSNLDINLAKQINILLTDFGVKLDDILMDPLMAGLGMGLEYSYSVNERIRLAALTGDRMLQVPMVCDTNSAWEAREATDETLDFGSPLERATWWEVATGLAALNSGADLLIVRGPQAAMILKRAIDDLVGSE